VPTRSLEDLLARALEAHAAARLADARALYRQALRAAPRNARAWFGLGSVNAQDRRPHEAIHQIERAIALDGPRAEYHHNLAGAKGSLGRFAEAEAHMREALRLNPRYAEACFNYAGLRRFQRGDDLRARVAAMLGDGPWSDRDRCFLHFAAAKIDDDLGNHDEAFAHYAAGNAARGARFDREAYRAQVDAIVEVFDTATVARLAPAGDPDERYVFVVGMPRSGTTLVEEILAAHPHVHGAGELPDVGAIAGTLPSHAAGERPFPHCVRALPADVLAAFGRAYAKRVGDLAPGARRHVDKQPLNHRHLGLIACMLPRARVLHCVRGVLDTCLSCYFQNFRGGIEWSFDLEDIAFFYAQYRRLMAHWEQVLPEPPLRVEYERLTQAPEAVARSMIGHVGLEWDARCLAFHRAGRTVHTASRWQVRQPIYTRSVARWHRYAPHLGPLIEALRENGIAVPEAAAAPPRPPP